MRNAMGVVRVSARVYVHPYVRFDRVSNSEEGLEAGCYAPAKFHDSEWVAGEAMRTDLS